MPDQDTEQQEEHKTPLPQRDPPAGRPRTEAASEAEAVSEAEAAPETGEAPKADEAKPEPLSEEEGLEMIRKHKQAYRQRIEDAKARIRTRAEWRRLKRLGQTHTYTVQPGDTLETVAMIFYAKPERWPEIYEANAARISGPAELHPQPLEPGTELVIP